MSRFSFILGLLFTKTMFMETSMPGLLRQETFATIRSKMCYCSGRELPLCSMVHRFLH